MLLTGLEFIVGDHLAVCEHNYRGLTNPTPCVSALKPCLSDYCQSAANRHAEAYNLGNRAISFSDFFKIPG